MERGQVASWESRTIGKNNKLKKERREKGGRYYTSQPASQNALVLAIKIPIRHKCKEKKKRNWGNTPLAKGPLPEGGCPIMELLDEVSGV